jgi:hypothetical protein
MSSVLRLIFVLMLAMPGVPARACDPAPVTTQHAGHDMMEHQGHFPSHKAPQRAPAAHHDCIGCIAPIDIRLYRPAAAPQPKATREPRPADMAFLLARAMAPEPPPPRSPV